MIDALLYHGMREWSPRGICGRTRDFRSRDGACRGLARRRQAPPLAPTPGAHRAPGLPALSSSCTSSHATCPIARRFPCRLRSNVPSAWRGVGLLGHLSLGVWHFTLRFVLPGSWVGYPRATAAERQGWDMQSPFGPKVYPKYFWHTRAAIGHATALAAARRVRVAEHTLRRTRVCPHAHDDLLFPPTHPVAF